MKLQRAEIKISMVKLKMTEWLLTRIMVAAWRPWLGMKVPAEVDNWIGNSIMRQFIDEIHDKNVRGQLAKDNE